MHQHDVARAELVADLELDMAVVHRGGPQHGDAHAAELGGVQGVLVVVAERRAEQHRAHAELVLEVVGVVADLLLLVGQRFALEVRVVDGVVAQRRARRVQNGLEVGLVALHVALVQEQHRVPARLLDQARRRGILDGAVVHGDEHVRLGGGDAAGPRRPCRRRWRVPSVAPCRTGTAPTEPPGAQRRARGSAG